MGKNNGSKFVPKKSLQPEIFKDVEHAVVEPRKFHGLYEPGKSAHSLITHAFFGAARAINFLGDAPMKEASGSSNTNPCLLKADFQEADGWKIERVVSPGANEVRDVVAENVASEYDVVRWMREWAKQASSLCDGHQDTQGYQQKAKLVVKDSPLPSRG